KVTSGWAAEASSNTGAKARHGPHQEAHQSTRTMPSALTVSSKLVDVSSTVAIGSYLSSDGQEQATGRTPHCHSSVLPGASPEEAGVGWESRRLAEPNRSARPDARATGRPTAARIESSDATSVRRSFARVTPV